MIMSLFVFWMWPTIKDITISLHKCHRKKNVHLNCHCNIYRNVKKRKKCLNYWCREGDRFYGALKTSVKMHYCLPL